VELLVQMAATAAQAVIPALLVQAEHFCMRRVAVVHEAVQVVRMAAVLAVHQIRLEAQH
jgi:hypothetical protein